jgi:hypothetical protein
VVVARNRTGISLVGAGIDLVGLCLPFRFRLGNNDEEAMACPKEKAGVVVVGAGGGESRGALSTERGAARRFLFCPLKPEHSKLARSRIQRGDGRDSREVEEEECGLQG